MQKFDLDFQVICKQKNESEFTLFENFIENLDENLFENAKVSQNGQIVDAPENIRKTKKLDIDCKRNKSIFTIISEQFENYFDAEIDSQKFSFNYHRLLKYEEGDFFAKHSDRIEDIHHMLTCLLLPPNQTYDGGNLKLYLKETEVKDSETKIIICDPSQWTLILFDPKIEHEVEPIISGTRYVIKSSVSYENFHKIKTCVQIPYDSFSINLTEEEMVCYRDSDINDIITRRKNDKRKYEEDLQGLEEKIQKERQELEAHIQYEDKHIESMQQNLEDLRQNKKLKPDDDVFYLERCTKTPKDILILGMDDDFHDNDNEIILLIYSLSKIYPNMKVSHQYVSYRYSYDGGIREKDADRDDIQDFEYNDNIFDEMPYILNEDNIIYPYKFGSEEEGDYNDEGGISYEYIVQIPSILIMKNE